MTSRATLAAMVALVAVGAAGLGVAQDGYPSRTIRLVVGFSAGGPTDLPARLIAEKIGDALGRRLTVENKTGAGGMLATRDVLAQEADGHTLLLCTHFESINIAAYRNPGYKLDEIAPISLIAKYYYALALAPAVPASTFEEFVQYAKAHPGELNYATIGTGSAQEILARQIEGLTGIKLNKVPFRLSSQIITDMISGRVHLYFAPTLAVLPYYQSKQLKVLAMSSPERLSNAPDVPALKENGLEFVRFGWLGICAKSGTPQPIIAALNRHIVSAVAAPDYQDKIIAGGSIPASSTPAELKQIIDKTLEDVASTIREFGMQQD
jgi:tripartite-type tricarboxylate transporter receptor subunit TctC